MIEMGKKALLIISNSVSGAEKRGARLAIALHQRGVPVCLILNDGLLRLLQGNEEFAGKLDDGANSVPCYSFELSNRGRVIRTVLNSFRVNSAISRSGACSIHCYLGAFSIFYLWSIARMRRISFEITSPDVADRIVKPALGVFRWQFRFFNAVTPTVAARLSRTKVFSEGTRLNKRLKSAPTLYYSPKPEILSGSLDVPKENLIVYASRFIRRKNVHVFLEGVALFLKTNPDWKIKILGCGPMEDELREIVEKHRIEKNVTIGFEPAIFDTLLRSRIFASVIEPDNYPSQSVMEAMSCANAILLSNGGLSKRFLPEGNGCLVEEIKPSAIAEALVDMTKDANCLAQMGSKSREVVETYFSEHIYLDYFLDTLGG